MLGSPRSRSLLLAAALFTATGLGASPALADASAQDVAQARALGQQAQEAFERKDYAASEKAWAAAAKLYPLAPTLPLGLARAQAAGGKLVAAHETYRSIEVKWGSDASLSEPFKEAVAAARTEGAAVGARVPNVVISVSGAASPQVTVDGVELPAAALGFKRPIDPGSHKVRAEADEHAAVEQTFTVKEGTTAEVKIAMGGPGGTAVAPVEAPAPDTVPDDNKAPPAADSGTTQVSSGSSRKTWAYVAFGVGAAGLVVGSVTGLMAMGKKSDLDKACLSGRCPSSAQGDIDSYSSLGTISTVGFIAGGVGAAAGAVLLLTAPSDADKHAGVWPVVGPTGVGAVGRF